MPRPDRNAHGVSTPALLRLSASAAVMNAVVPLALCLQVALAGKMAGSAVQAAFGLVVVTCGMGTSVFNFLVDGVVAGSGETYDWTNLRVPRGCSRKGWILAGGLDPANVGDAIGSCKPTAVDVASGVADEGGVKKDPAKVDAFIANAKSASMEMA